MFGDKRSEKPTLSDTESLDIDDYDNESIDETYRDYDVSPERDAELARVLIETDSYINRIQLTLENKYLKQTRYKKDGKWEYAKIPTQIPGTKPLANEFGISQITGRVKSVFHHSVTLGQIDKQQYGLFMQRFIKDFVRSLISHRIDWGIDHTTLRDIRRIVVDGVLLFITRPIGNVERASLTRHVGEDQKNNNRGFLDNIGNKFKKNRSGY